MTQQRKAYIAIFITVILWGSSFVAIRAALVDFAPGELALLRYLFASFVLIPSYFAIPKRGRLRKRHWPAILLFGITGIAAYNIALNTGEVTVSAGAASFIVSQIPTATIIFAVLLLKERLTPASWVGIAISVSGVLLISLGQQHSGGLNQGVLYLLAAILCAGIYSGLQRLITPFYHPLQLVTWFIWVGTALLLGYAHTLFQQLQHASLATVLWAVYLGVFPGAIGYMCWTYALKHVPASKAASYLFALPIVATLLGWLVLGEVPKMATLIGGAIAISGAFLVKIRPHKR